MNRNTNHIAEIALLVWAFAKSPVLAFFLLMYFIYVNEEKKKEVAGALAHKKEVILTTDDINRIAETERKRAATEDDLGNAVIMGQTSSFDFYHDFIIDNYDNKFYRVMAPNGHYLEKIYMSLEEAKNEVDAALLVMPVQKSKERKVYDVRYVR
jgi:hypothetical protein